MTTGVTYPKRLGDGRLVSDLTPRQVSAMRSRLHKELAAEWPLRHNGWMHRSGARRAAHILRMLRIKERGDTKK